ncbi:MAG: polysaccharide biosynthesis/export family protein, partial [Bacteroidetes bacterium]|nr:polysaccharide biosynthesis/export family protein [Bacteroidota bacterium]
MKKILFTCVFSLIFSVVSFAQTTGRGMTDVTVDDANTEGITSDDAAKIAEEIQNRQNDSKGAKDVNKSAGEKKGFVPKGDDLEETTEVKDSLTEEERIRKDERERVRNGNQEEIVIYGQSFFDNGNLKVYKAAGHTKAPDNYILGIGDEINVSIWGYSEHQTVYTIGANGSIDPKTVGRIYLRGMTFGEAKKVIASRFGRVYDLRNSEISIDLNYSKVIRVNIVGEVKNPGTYSVSSINSA